MESEGGAGRTIGQGRGRLGPTHSEPQFLLRSAVGAREAERDTYLVSPA